MDESVVGAPRAALIAHLHREHAWDQWNETDLHAVHDLHSELHEQLDLPHPITLLTPNLEGPTDLKA